MEKFILTNKKCPKCKISLQSALFHNAEVDYCSKCLGIWFDKEELRLAKDEKDKDLKWQDVDLWENDKEFKLSLGIRICPVCRVPLYEVYYGKSKIIVDLCNLCQGIWLDRGEFKKLINWLKKDSNYKILNKYSGSLVSEATEIFMGPETLKEEITDFLLILKLLGYKLSAKYPKLSSMASSLYRLMPK